jgi:uncharacterized repeat protein (TIGR01451 family)
MGEVWCVTLWEARANLIRKHGWTTGNRLILELVTDGMALSPPNPNYLQARDAILQAELLDFGGANQKELWNAFAKRGMGVHATCPGSFTSIGVQESFEVPDDMQVSPFSGTSFSFQSGRVLLSSCQVYFLSNIGSNIVNWTAYATDLWVSVDPASGSISPGSSNTASVCLTAAANTLLVGDYSATIVFSNTASGVTQTRSVVLQLSPLFFPLDTEPAWSREGEWDFGKPAGLGGTENGNPDPAAAASGTNVFGVNLHGDYSLEIGGPAYLTAGPFDFSGYTGMRLHFQRWLNTDVQPYVYATIELSSDGTNWNLVWDNGTSEIADHAWTPASYDISALADNHTNVYIRWGHRVAAPLAFAYSGWNIDDIGFVGNPSQVLTVTIPPVADVGAGTLAGTVAASPASATDLTVALTSSDASAVAVPASVMIPAGQSNVVFDLTIADELDGRGMQTVLIRATAPDYVAGSSNIEVLDSAAVTLQLSLSGTAIEGEGTLEGAVSIRDVQTNALVVHLSSSDTTALQVPDSIFIPVGQTTAVFAATVVDDNLIDGPQVAVVTAHVPGWIDATGSVLVQDNENLNLTVTMPASAWENSGLLPNAGSVSISGALETNLTVSLASSAPGRLSVPAFVTIPSGQVSNTFDLIPIDNSIADGSQVITIEASAPGFTNGTGFISVLDDESPPTPSNPSPANLATNVDRASGLAWQPGFLLGGTITNDVYFGANPAPGPGEFVGSTINQNWTLPLLAPQTTYYWQIVARRIGVTQGPVWQFTTRGVDHFSWNTLSSPQFVNQPFSVSVTARDAYDSVVSNFTGIVSLRGLPAAPSPTNSGAFVNGVWRGGLILSKPAANESLVADDGAGHTGISDLFDAVLTNDLSITIGANPDPVPAGRSLTYALAVANSGSAVATDVTVTNILPPNVTLISILLSQGDWQETNGVIAASLGSVPGGTNATITLVVIPTTVGDTLTNIAWVSRAELDPYLDNNTAEIETKVAPPAVSIADAAITEGNVGTTDMLFAVTLSASSPETVSVNYSTASGSAHEGEDYLGTNGVLVLPPGITNAFISVAVIGDEIVESNEEFFVNLSDPTNAVPGRSQGVGTIINDDDLHGRLDHFSWNAFASPQYTNVPFVVTITAASAGENVVTGFDGTVTFSGSSATGAVTVIRCIPIVSGAFTNGIWSGEITLLDRGNNVVLKADDGNGHAGFSASFEAAPFNMPATVVSPPTNQIVVRGDTVTFLVIADGTAPLSYQWSFNGTNLPDATNSLLVLTNVQLSDGGSYAVAVSNAFGSEESSNAVLSVGEPPTIVVQPTNQTARLGAAAGWEVVAAGTAPLSYQWSFNGTNLLDATNSLLVIPNAQLSDAGSYAVQVSNAFGSENSSNALLTIGLPPAIVIQPANLAVAVGGVATFSMVAAGTAPLSYQWSFNGTNLLEATNSLLVLTNVQLSDAGSYAVEVANGFGSEESSNAVLSVGEPPTIVVQSTNQTVRLGDTAVLEVVADGTAPLSYQWSFNGTNLLEATNSLLVIPNAQLSDAGSYAVQVSNAFGSENSSNALLTIGLPPAIVIQPANLAVAVGGVATFSMVAEGSAPLSYQWSFKGTNLLNATNNSLVLTNVQLSAAGNYAVGVSNAFGSAQSSNAVLEVDVPLPPCTMAPAGLVSWWAAENNALDSVGGNNGRSTNGMAFVPGKVGTAFLFSGENSAVNLGDPENLRLTNSLSIEAWIWINTLPSAQQGQGQIFFRGDPRPCLDPYFLSVQTDGAIRFHIEDELETVACGVDLDTAIVATQQWVHIAAVLVATNGTMEVYVDGQLVAQTNTAVRPFGNLDGGGVAIGNRSAGSNSEPFDGLIDELAVYGRALPANEILSIYNSGSSGKCPLSPAILVQPTNQTVEPGFTVEFESVAAGTPSLSYQWSFNGTNLPDATNSVLAITNVQLSDAGIYAVQVSNASGSENSSNALLTVVLVPAFVSQPTDQVVKLGDTATFEAVAVGTSPLNWQWSFNGKDLLDATNSVLVITNVQLSDADIYAVQVSNAFGSQKSSNALLSVSLPPAILVQPTNQILMAGGIARFGVVAADTPPLNYRWRRDGIDLVDAGRILGANSSGLIISNLVQSDSGEYSIAVSNSSGSVFSSNATLFVYVIDHFAWDPIPSPRFVNVPFPVRIQASDATNGLLAGFTGSVVLTSTAGVPVDPSVSGDFVQGEWTGSVTVSQAATGAVLVADDGSGHLGYANPINVIGLPLLSVERSGGSLLISWSAEASAFALETSADLSSWSPLATPIDLSGGKYQIRVRISTTNSFYRLRFVGPEGYRNRIITR